MDVVFAFDASKQSLVFAHPSGQLTSVPVKDIEATGYWEPKGRLELELRKCLPRFDRPSIIAANGKLPPFRR